MLVLTRKIGESLIIGGGIQVKVLDVCGKRLKIGVQAPRDVAILRKYTRQHGKQPRWFYYLGASHQDLGEYAAAIDAYRTCAELGGWPEEGAWAPGYYSVLFEDPDGIRLEMNHVPGKGLLGDAPPR